ncbi:MAG: hypothetical protein GWP91_06995 [Rhodobacterales bacterium]|nr:hypothetical protein [Rhodobacterales bacterium]
MSPHTLVVHALQPPIVLVHGGAGSYLATTTPERRRLRGDALERAALAGMSAMNEGGSRAAVLAAIAVLEADPQFNAGRGARLQKDGAARMSAAMMNGTELRLSAVYNVEHCLHPSALADSLQASGDRNRDGQGSAHWMSVQGIAPQDVRTTTNIARWQALVNGADHVDRESAIGDADEHDVSAAREANLAVPDDLLPPPERRYGTVGVVALGADGQLWACTSTGGRGHESVGRISVSPTPAGNYATPEVALSATGFGEQILDLNLCGRIATRVIDGNSLEDALKRTFIEVQAHGGLLGVIGVTADGSTGYAHSTEACGVAWVDATGVVGRDVHSSGV